MKYAKAESMILYYGKHGAEQHLHGKPIDFGYKIWSLGASTGYLMRFIRYQGAKSTPLSHQNAYGWRLLWFWKCYRFYRMDHHIYLFIHSFIYIYIAHFYEINMYQRPLKVQI